MVESARDGLDDSGHFALEVVAQSGLALKRKEPRKLATWFGWHQPISLGTGK